MASRGPSCIKAVVIGDDWQLEKPRLASLGLEVYTSEQAYRVAANIEGEQFASGQTASIGGPLGQRIIDFTQEIIKCGGCSTSATTNTTLLLQAICSHNAAREQIHLVVVGYIMKPSREQQLASAGLLHVVPVDGVAFVPLDLSRPLDTQPRVQVVLHKGSDELVYDGAGQLTWSNRLKALQQHLQDNPDICVVDPFENTAKVLNRLKLAALLQGVEQLQLPGGVRARGPRYKLVQSFARQELEGLAEAGLLAPYIVKPLVACGVSDSHQMALVLHEGALLLLQGAVPTPAIIQEFANHGGVQYKVYVLGSKVFHSVRDSIPDVGTPAPEAAPCQEHVLLFDSLASLPTKLPEHWAAVDAAAPKSQEVAAEPLDQAALEAVSDYLRGQLGLTLFGFDVVVAQATGEYLVIDVNYFPNFRGGKDTATWFRQAMLQALMAQKSGSRGRT